MKKRTTEILRITIYIWMGIQIVLGCCFAVCNLGVVPGFEESRELLAMSTSLCVDEYTGYLYPLLLRGSSILSSWIRVPACALIYLLQLVVAYFSYEYFLEKVVFYRGWKKMVLRKRFPLYVAFAMTLPVVLQVHMAVLPYSLASSLFIALLTKIICICEAGYVAKGKDIVVVALLWILSAQICVDYAWLAGVLVGLGALWYMWLHKHFCMKLCLMILVSILCIIGLNTTLQTPGSMGKIQRSPEGVLLTRVVWPKFTQLASFWGEEVNSQWTELELLGISTFPEKVIYEFGPHLDNLLGYEEANRVYRNMIKQTILVDTKYVISGIVKDSGSYICPPLTMFLHLHGVGSSYTGWNYGRMKDYTPRLADYYVDISLGGWIYLLVACLGLILLNVFPKDWRALKERKRTCKQVVFSLLTAVWVNIWYVMVSGHMQDYKKVLVISVLWAFGMIAVLNRTEEKNYLR